MPVSVPPLSRYCYLRFHLSGTTLMHSNTAQTRQTPAGLLRTTFACNFQEALQDVDDREQKVLDGPHDTICVVRPVFGSRVLCVL